MTTYSDGVDAWQFERHLNQLILNTKTRLGRIADATPFDEATFRPEMDRLVALEACRAHALSFVDEPLTPLAETGYRIINEHLAGAGQ